MKNNIELSIIIVNYKVAKEIMACIHSIFESKPRVRFEIIVVDNDEEHEIGNGLNKNFPEIKYIKSEKNIGFGAGNNLGARAAIGEYLFFLNPDTLVKKNAINELVKFTKNNFNSGMIAPLLFDSSGNVYPNQGSNEYNLANAIITSSFINKVFPNNVISSKFFHRDWDRKTVEEFDVVPGTAFMIRKNLFEKVGMFDENLFLYFEEYDLAKRVKSLGYKNYILPRAKIIHTWEVSTKKRKDIDKIFAKSRYIFFRKHYGVLFALIINLISNFGKNELLLSLTLGLSVFLGLYKIGELMTFIGDQGWFYLSAKDMLVNGQIPLVGIASSHPWLHQGPFWTYLLAFTLWIFKFDPVSGAYLAVALGILSVIGIYAVGSRLFSKRVGLIASLLYTTSPLTVYYMRFPYHTSPIPLFVIALIFPLYKIIQGKLNYLPLAILLLVILYNFEIATITLWGVLGGVLLYIFLNDKENFKHLFGKKLLILLSFSLIVPLFPIILYDVKNGFPQTLKLAAWSFYRIISLFGYNPQQAFSINKIIAMFNFLFDNFVKLIFAENSFISFVIFIFLASWIINMIFKAKAVSYKLIYLLIFIPLFFVVLNQTPSDAYLPIFFPTLILLLSIFLNFIMSKKLMFVPVLIFIIVIATGNINFMLRNDFAFDKSGKLFTLDKRFQAASQILNIARNRDYNLKGKGAGSEFQSFTMNYEYLTWLLGHGPSEKTEDLKIYISESAKGIIIEDKNK